MGLCVELGQVPSQDGHNLSEERCLERSLRTVSASKLRPRPFPPQRGQKLAPWRPHRSPLSSSETEPHRSVCSPHLLGPAAREGSGGYLGRRRPPGKGQAWVWKCPPLRIRTSVIPPDPWELPHPQRPRARPEPRTHLCQQSPREAGAVCALIMASLHGPGGFQQSRPSR